VSSELGHGLLPKFAHGRMIHSRLPGCSKSSNKTKIQRRDNRDRESHAPFVKTYATLGYL